MKTLLTKFESTVRANFLGGERDQGRAMLRAIEAEPESFNEFAAAGRQMNKEVFAPPLSSAALFEHRIKTHMGAGKERGKAIQLASREDGDGYNLWRESGCQ